MSRGKEQFDFELCRIRDTARTSVLIAISYAIPLTAQLATVIFLAPSTIHHPIFVVAQSLLGDITVL